MAQNAAAFRREPTPARQRQTGWGRERDSNPRYGFPYTRFPGVRLQPLGHPSARLPRRRRTLANRLGPRNAMPLQPLVAHAVPWYAAERRAMLAFRHGSVIAGGSSHGQQRNQNQSDRRRARRRGL